MQSHLRRQKIWNCNPWHSSEQTKHIFKRQKPSTTVTVLFYFSKKRLLVTIHFCSQGAREQCSYFQSFQFTSGSNSFLHNSCRMPESKEDACELCREIKNQVPKDKPSCFKEANNFISTVIAQGGKCRAQRIISQSIKRTEGYRDTLPDKELKGRCRYE